MWLGMGWPRKLKRTVADDLRSIFYASSKEKALEFFSWFKERWEKEIPSAVKYLENSLDACLTFFRQKADPTLSETSLKKNGFHFGPQTSLSVSIRSLSLEQSRSCLPQAGEIIAGEQACYNLLAFICLKMELHCLPVGRQGGQILLGTKCERSDLECAIISNSFRSWQKKILHKKVDITMDF